MHKRLTPRFFYCGMVNTPGYSAMLDEPLHMGAASNKMVAVVRAMRDAGSRTYLLSLPVLGRSAHRRYVPSVIMRSEGIPQIFLSTMANPYFRKIHAVFGFAFFCIVHVAKHDRIILYNHAVEYLLGLLILVIKGNKPILDIEDAPRGDETGWRGLIGRPLFNVFNKLVSEQKITVSETLANMLDLNNYCVVYGATRHKAIASMSTEKLSCKAGNISEPLRIHYGGTLTADTGVDLFCEAIDQFVKLLRRETCYVCFVVTGFGSEKKINALKTRCLNSGVRISHYPDLSPKEYLDQFRRCHAALSLKLPDSEMAITTFPSKVVDITTYGLLLISTRASDVPLLFDDSCAILLPEATPDALANAIMAIVNDPLHMQQVARHGAQRARELFDSNAVGKRINDFITANKA